MSLSRQCRTFTTWKPAPSLLRYDGFGRLDRLTETMPGNTLETSFEYDNFGNMVKQTYPSSYAVENNYDTRGYLTTATSPPLPPPRAPCTPPVI